jgi:hypothetical protein
LKPNSAQTTFRLSPILNSTPCQTLGQEQSVTKFIAIILINLVTSKVKTKLELLFNKPPLIINMLSFCNYTGGTVSPPKLINKWMGCQQCLCLLWTAFENHCTVLLGSRFFGYNKQLIKLWLRKINSSGWLCRSWGSQKGSYGLARWRLTT